MLQAEGVGRKLTMPAVDLRLRSGEVVGLSACWVQARDRQVFRRNKVGLGKLEIGGAR